MKQKIHNNGNVLPFCAESDFSTHLKASYYFFVLFFSVVWEFPNPNRVAFDA